MSDVNIQTFSGKVNVSNNFTVGSGHLFVDTQNNKVGLNTTTPEANLHVTGNTYISTDISVGGTLTMGTVTVEALHSLDAVTSVGNTTPHTVEFQNTDTSLVASGNVEVAKELTVSGNAAVYSNLTVSGNVEVGTANLFVDTVNSRVGIGTTSPTTKFTIYGDNTEDEGGLLMKVVDKVNLNNGFTGIGLGGYLQVAKSAIIHERNAFYGRGNLMFCNSDTADTTDVSNTHARMTITSTGDVGIGTTSPNEKLQISGNIGLNWSNDTRIIMNYDNSYRQGIELDAQSRNMTLFSTTNDSGGDIIFKTRAGAGSSDTDYGTERMRINNGGNVGIGTTNPGSLLSIQSTSGDQLRLNYNDDYYNVIERDSSGNLNFLEKRGPGSTLTPHITMLSNSGKVGIGTNNPNGKLHVSVSSADGNSDDALIIGGPTNCTGNTNLRIGCHNDYAWIQSHCGEPLRLNPGGNSVQYGTSNTTLSDDRIKENEMYIENATDTLLKLKPQIYDKKLVWNISELNETVNVVRESGLITQDVWYNAPELRHLVELGKDAFPETDKPFTDNNPQNDPDYSSWGDQASTLNYTGLISYLIKSNQELHARIQALENTS